MNYIFYYTSTGNSIALSKMLTIDLDNTVIVNMAEYLNKPYSASNADNVIFISPIHAWGSPIIFNRFIENLDLPKSNYCVTLLHSAGNPGNAYSKFKEQFDKKGIQCDAAFEIKMPSNYLLFHNPPVGKELIQILSDSERQYMEVLSMIKKQKRIFPEVTPEKEKLSETYNDYLQCSNQMAKGFYADEKCTGCGICAKVCHVKTISYDDKKRPIWTHDKCVHCLSCLHWCPTEAIQFTSKTITLNRYHHPDVKVKDMFLS